jgi:hypothetical protein
MLLQTIEHGRPGSRQRSSSTPSALPIGSPSDVCRPTSSPAAETALADGLRRCQALAAVAEQALARIHNTWPTLKGALWF